MQVVLLERIRSLGHLGDIVAVKPGYARNYLVPYGKAVPATKENIAYFEQRRAELEKAEAELLAAAQKRAKALEGMVIIVKRKTADEGRLYGSVTLTDIVDALTAQSPAVEVERRELDLPEGPIRTVGEYVVHAHLHSDVIVDLKVQVEAE